MTDGPRTISPQQRAAERSIHAGAQEAGVKIAGLTEVTEHADTLGGSKSAPIVVGQKTTVVVRVAEDGTLLPRREDSDKGSPPATSILSIEVIPSIEFDSDDDPHTIWTGYARQTDVGNSRVFATALSGATDAEQRALEAGRPAKEYRNDPKYIDGSLALHARSPEDAVNQALGQLASSGRMNSGFADRGPGVSPFRKKVVGVVAGVAIAGGTVLGVTALGGDDAATPVEAEVVIEDNETPTETETEEVAEEPVVDESSTEAEDAEPEPTPDPPPSGPTLAAGTYLTSALVDAPCGSYPIYLRSRAFNGMQIEVDQLSTENGNPFQTASGFWSEEGAIAVLSTDSLFEIWTMRPSDGGMVEYGNIYGSAASNLPLTEEEHLALLQALGLEALAAAVGASEDTCLNPVSEASTEFSAFP